MRAAFESCHKGWGISEITALRLSGKEISPRGCGRGGDGDGTGSVVRFQSVSVAIPYSYHQSLEVVIPTTVSMALSLSGCEITLRENESEDGRV
jgi:hypothetical protein